MASALNNPNFWSDEAKTYGFLKQDGSLKYILLDKKFKMVPLVRKTKTTFTQFLANDPRAKACKVVVNGTLYGVSLMGKARLLMGNVLDQVKQPLKGLWSIREDLSQAIAVLKASGLDKSANPPMICGLSLLQPVRVIPRLD